ncbi:hypothetical protein MRB53_033110 [Persea americana]|uniref:Uncharacterized protein n=1 Tax=Persea americana TaxID=3435 RepID=A0ACC2KU30_PERAE|nr:hypothetical protein MRB53_033110 [Persea americana]
MEISPRLEAESAAPVHGSRLHREDNLDNNMVIILAASLCALVVALGLNSIVRCARRCHQQRNALNTPHEAMDQLASTGLKRSDLCRIPVMVYQLGRVLFRGTECPICLGEFIDGEKVRALPKCNHGYHMKCIDTWLVSNSTCPTCRHSLVDHPLPDSSHENGVRSPENDSDRPSSVVVIVVNQ